MKETQVHREEINQPGVHQVSEQRTTTLRHREAHTTGAQGQGSLSSDASRAAHLAADKAQVMGTQLIDTVKANKQQLSYMIPITLAILLALALLTFRPALFSHSPPPRTWTDKAADTVKSHLPSAAAGPIDMAAEKANSAAEYARLKAEQAATYAKETLHLNSDNAYDAAGELADRGSTAAKKAAYSAKQQAADTIHDKTHRSYVDSASEYIHDKASEVVDGIKSRVGMASESVKHAKELAAEEARHKAELLKEQARHTAAEKGYDINDRVNSAKQTAHDYKRAAKDKASDYAQSL